MTQPVHPPAAPGARPGRPQQRVTQIIRTDDLPHDVNAWTDGSVIYLRAGLDRATARRVLRDALTALRGYPGLTVFPLLAVEMRLRHLARRAEDIVTNAGVVIQQAGNIASEHIGPVIAGSLAVGGVAVGATAIALAPAAHQPAIHHGPYRPHQPVIAQLAPKPLAYLGAYEPDAPRSYAGMDTFGKAIGETPNLAGYYSGWGEPFQAGFAHQAMTRGAWPLVQLDPDGQDLPWIAAGGSDTWLKMFAEQVADFGGPVVISFGHEMNAPWETWGYGNVPAKVFVAAWRHIVTVFRGENADNVTWLWDVSQSAPTTGPVCTWWPGSSYVTWVGIDAYYNQPSDIFANIFAPTISEVRECSQDPVLITETAASVPAGQLRSVADLFASIRGSGYLGFVWFDEDQGPVNNWRLETDPVDVAKLFRQETASWRLEHHFTR